MISERTIRSEIDFYPRPPWGGRPFSSKLTLVRSLISIHALRGEGDGTASGMLAPGDLFLSTPSVGRATIVALPVCVVHRFLSTPSVGRATQAHRHQADRIPISIHALRGEGDGTASGMLAPGDLFLSTPSVGRATRTTLVSPEPQQKFLSTPSVGRATGCYHVPSVPGKISIHALRGEGDAFKRLVADLPVRISIHALRGEGDIGDPPPKHSGENFYPRPPWGGRLYTATGLRCAVEFLSTPSVGRATDVVVHRHHPFAYFYPRPPWGGRHQLPAGKIVGIISIHALRGEGDHFGLSGVSDTFTFLSTPSVGRATVGRRQAREKRIISIHALRGEGDSYRPVPALRPQ